MSSNRLVRRGVCMGIGLAAVVAGGCALALAPRAATDATPAFCPARLASDQQAAAPTGWTAERSARDGPLAAIAFYDGPIVDQVELAPAAERRDGDSVVSSWTFDGSMKTVRMVCKYAGTDIVLTHALPVTVKQCSLRTRRGAALIDAGALRCR